MKRRKITWEDRVVAWHARVCAAIEMARTVQLKPWTPPKIIRITGLALRKAS